MTPDEIAQLRQQRYNATVVWLRKAHSDLMTMRVKSDFPRPAHKPGQYCSLGLGNWEPRLPGCQEEELKPGDEAKLVRRAYSISCPILAEVADSGCTLAEMDTADWLEFYIVLVRENAPGHRPPALTPRLFMLREGDRINMGEKITGHYNLDAIQPDDTVLLLSTGTGEAPNNYMLWQLLKSGHRGRVLSACCVRMKQDLGYLATHEAVMRQFPNYTYLPLTTREASAAGRKVYIQDLISSGQLEEHLGKPLDPAHTHVYLCGNPKMIGVPEKDKATGERRYPEPVGVIELLERRGFQADNATAKIKGNVHFEEYW
jgi:ferredoxin--NADP+ reductase